MPHVYHDRSPLYKADKIRSPVIVFHGEVDMVVPPNQAQEIVDKVRASVPLPLSARLTASDQDSQVRKNDVRCECPP